MYKWSVIDKDRCFSLFIPFVMPSLGVFFLSSILFVLYGCDCDVLCVRVCVCVSRSNELNCDDPNFQMKSAFVIKIVSNHTETSLVYLLRSFKSKTNLSKPLFRFFDGVPLQTEFSPSSAFSVSQLSIAVAVAVAVLDAAIVVTLHVLSKSSEKTGLPNLHCQKSSLEQRQQRKRFISSFNGDSFVIGDNSSGF